MDRISRCAIAALLLLAVSRGHAQTVQLRQLATGATDIAAQVGDTLAIEVDLDLGAVRASGLALHVQLPAAGLAVIGDDPFRALGPFADGIEFANRVVAPQEAFGVPAGSTLMAWAVVLGPGTDSERSRSAAGPVAVFRAVCTAPLDAGEIRAFSNPVHETKVVLADGRGERPLVASVAVRVAVREPAAKGLAHSWAAVKSARGAD